MHQAGILQETDGCASIWGVNFQLITKPGRMKHLFFKVVWVRFTNMWKYEKGLQSKRWAKKTQIHGWEQRQARKKRKYVQRKNR